MEFLKNFDGVEGEITAEDGTIYMTDGFKDHFSDMNKRFSPGTVSHA